MKSRGPKTQALRRSDANNYRIVLVPAKKEGQ